MAQAKVIAIPSISGGSVQIKTLAAIASGSSIVATPFALRGLSNYPSCVRVADRPEEFASKFGGITGFAVGARIVSRGNCLVTKAT